MYTGPEWRRTWAERALDWLYPVACAGCGRSLSFSSHRLLCAACLGRVAWLTDRTSCPRCARPLGPHARADRACPDCAGAPLRFTRAVAAARYQEPLRGALRAFKFQGVRTGARALGLVLARRVAGAAFAKDLEAVVPVPLHVRREHGRGYNQAGLLARYAAEALGLPVAGDVLVRTRDTPPQAGLERADRLRNVDGAFAPARERVGLRRCLLVDDIMTTGATLSACASALRAGGLERIYAATVAR